MTEISDDEIMWVGKDAARILDDLLMFGSGDPEVERRFPGLKNLIVVQGATYDALKSTETPNFAHPGFDRQPNRAARRRQAALERRK